MTKENLLQIGAIAKLADVNIQTIRYYEKRKILKPEYTKESGYRLYSKDAVKTIIFIKHAQELGFKLDEIKNLINLRANSVNRCESVRKKSTAKLKDVQEKILMLRRIEKTLQKLIKNCENNETTNNCPIIENLELSS